jgi:hypothetical protein
MAELRTGDGRALLPLLRTELNRLRRRLVLILELIRELEAERAEALAAAANDAMVRKITALQRIRGIGSNFAAVLVREVLYPSFANRRQLASYVGIAPMPYQSGATDRDRSISRAGNPRARTTLIQLAWLWLRYQPGSALAAWFRERVGTLQGRTRRIAIVANGKATSNRALALRGDRGASGRRRDQSRGGADGVEKQRCRGRHHRPDGDVGSATVFVFGGQMPPCFRWVASRRSSASCKRHYGAGPS